MQCHGLHTLWSRQSNIFYCIVVCLPGNMLKLEFTGNFQKVGKIGLWKILFSIPIFHPKEEAKADLEMKDRLKKHHAYERYARRRRGFIEGLVKLSLHLLSLSGHQWTSRFYNLMDSVYPWVAIIESWCFSVITSNGQISFEKPVENSRCNQTSMSAKKGEIQKWSSRSINLCLQRGWISKPHCAAAC